MGTFVSLVPACACGRQTSLDLFSIATGRMLRKLAPVRTGSEQLGTPVAASDGRLLMTLTSGARCAAHGDYMECPRFAPESCHNTVETYSPAAAGPRALFTIPGSEAITSPASPNPGGSKVALTLTPCVSRHGTTGVFVRDLSTGATHAIETSANRCDGFGPVAWNPTGDRLAFPVDRAGGAPIAMAGGIGCPEDVRKFVEV
jgi:hypothetical protein